MTRSRPIFEVRDTTGTCVWQLLHRPNPDALLAVQDPDESELVKLADSASIPVAAAGCGKRSMMRWVTVQCWLLDRLRLLRP